MIILSQSSEKSRSSKGLGHWQRSKSAGLLSHRLDRIATKMGDSIPVLGNARSASPRSRWQLSRLVGLGKHQETQKLGFEALPGSGMPTWSEIIYMLTIPMSMAGVDRLLVEILRRPRSMREVVQSCLKLRMQFCQYGLQFGLEDNLLQDIGCQPLKSSDSNIVAAISGLFPASGASWSTAR
jgi:hypothetical protein